MFVIEEELKKLPQKPGAAEYSRISVRKLTADHRLKRW